MKILLRAGNYTGVWPEDLDWAILTQGLRRTTNVGMFTALDRHAIAAPQIAFFVMGWGVLLSANRS